MRGLAPLPSDYGPWLADLKARSLRRSQSRCKRFILNYFGKSSHQTKKEVPCRPLSTFIGRKVNPGLAILRSILITGRKQKLRLIWLSTSRTFTTISQAATSQVPVRSIEQAGCILIRHGGKHNWYRNPKTGVTLPIPRHREIKELLARHILRLLSNSST